VRTEGVVRAKVPLETGGARLRRSTLGSLAAIVGLLPGLRPYACRPCSRQAGATGQQESAGSCPLRSLCARYADSGAVLADPSTASTTRYFNACRPINQGGLARRVGVRSQSWLTLLGGPFRDFSRPILPGVNRRSRACAHSERSMVRKDFASELRPA